MSEPREDGTQDSADSTGEGIGDDQLPEDLQPGEDNPLAEGLEDGESPGDLLEDGKHADESAGADSHDDEQQDGGEPHTED